MNEDAVLPPIPAGLNMPFCYASLSAAWVYFEVPPERVAPYLKAGDLQPALFGGRAVVCFDFQRYTAHLGGLLSTVNEVELNVLAVPTVRAAQAPELTLAEFLAGNEQTKVVGAYRLHVAADNPAAVSAGRALFAEPKFLTTFSYQVPDLNDPGVTLWNVTCNDPTDAQQSIFTLHADEATLRFAPSAMSPVAQYSRDDQGRLMSCTWNLHGLFRSALVGSGPAPELAFGQSPHAMRRDMQALLEGVRPAAVQIFSSPPAATQSRGFYVRPVV